MKTKNIITLLFLLATVNITGCKGAPTCNIDFSAGSLNLLVGQKYQLTASPAQNTYTWTSEDTNIATVDANGLVTAKGAGTTLITASSGGAACSIPVSSIGNTSGGDTDFLPAHIKANYVLVWNDEFDGASLDLTKWNYRAEGSVRHYATVSRHTIYLNGSGQLVILTDKDSDGNYFIGQVGTQGLFDPTYGYFECRAMMNKSLGPHVAFWLQSPTYGNVGDPAVQGTEIDIFEYHRKAPGVVFHNLHWDGYGEHHKSSGVNVPIAGIGSGFHTFGLEWTENEYVFYVNGKETWRTSTAVSRRSQYLILSTELTGWGGAPAEGNFPDPVIFDYVRVYQRK